LIKILVIDDDSATTELLESILSSHEFEIFTANYGPEGIKLAKEVDPDLVIVDLVVPGMNGYQITHNLRDFSNVPILVLSVIDKPEDIAQVLDEGADDYMIKPVHGNLLIARINTLTRRADVEKRAATKHQSFQIQT